MYVSQRGPTTVRDVTIENTDIGLSVSKKRNSVFSDIEIRNTLGAAVEDYEGRKVLYRDIDVRGYGDYGITLKRPTDVHVDRSLFRGMDIAGVYITDNLRGDGYKATVTNSTAIGNGQYGMYAEQTGTKGAGNKAKGSPVGCFQIKCSGGVN
jgi:hypothetical protein